MSDVELPAAGDLRERVLDIVEQAIDRVSDAVDDAPSPRERAAGVARGVRRHTRSQELATAAIVAAAPAIARAIGEQVSSRRSRATIKAVPALVVTRPALLGLGVGAAAFGGYVAYRVLRRRRRRGELEEGRQDVIETFDPSGYDLEEEVERMQDEGGDPDGAEHAQRPSRRFVRSRDDASAPTR